METRVVCGYNIGPDAPDHFYRDLSTYGLASTPDEDFLKIAKANAEAGPYTVTGISTDGGLFASQGLWDDLPGKKPDHSGITFGGPPPDVPYEEAREPISGALYSDRRLYTRKEGGEWKFWGIQPESMSMEDFWAIHDPQNTRGEENELQRKEEGPASAPVVEAAKGPTLQQASAAKGRRPRRTPGINDSHRINKSNIQPTSANMSTCRSLGSKKDDSIHHESRYAGNTVARSPKPHVEGTRNTGFEASHTQDHSGANSGSTVSASTPTPQKTGRGRGRPRKISHVPPKVHESIQNLSRNEGMNAPPLQKRPRGRPPGTRNRTLQRQSGDRQSKPALNSNVKDTLSAKRPRGRPSANKTREAPGEASKRARTSAVKGNVRVAKPRIASKHIPPIPSTHAMRTRARGPADTRNPS